MRLEYKIREGGTYDEGTTPYSGIVADATGDMGVRRGSKDDLSSLESRVKGFKMMSVEAFGERFDSDLHILEYPLLYHMLKYIGRF